VAYRRRRRSSPPADPSPSEPTDRTAKTASFPTRDVEEALRLTGGLLDVADMLIADMLGSLPQQIAEAAAALAGEDWERLRSIIHRIKGATAVCAVPALHHAVCELQRAAREADREGARAWLGRVEAERQRLAAEQDNPRAV
jgi:two-component system sensor histidine kinase BarA